MNKLIEIKGDDFVRMFLEEMYKSQKTEELNEFVLTNRIAFLKNIINDSHIEFDKIIEISSYLSKNNDEKTYEVFIADFLLGKEIKVGKYVAQNEDVNLFDEIENLKERLKVSSKENRDLQDQVKRSQEIVMEAIDLILS
ncbi:hypothetical protein [Vagococcus fluvialis]|uniref:hypothetical protein n=1 Tax=Vagococcus fluvialis TaxID=2738 RepID=UPI001D0B77D9|nr:hypothetical protein [Vagococcus fluvialis]UDM72733.1 hypothetical protein K5L00_14340 [Vagococcus fluvialis]UDM78455.1 hypothetical protein K5K98_14545 [Vagococcus fluvialis]UDM84008.1 hypothetical protein K5K96_14365 [Vagococcus fluvialis]